MITFTLTLLVVFIVSAIMFHYTLLDGRRFALSERQWEGVDYIWYGFAFLGLAIGGFQVQAAFARATHADLVRAVERRYFYIEQLTDMAVPRYCPTDPAQCQLLKDIQQAIRETQFTAGWPLAPIRFKGRVFDSLNMLIRERAQELNAAKLDGHVAAMTTSVLDLVGKARGSERGLGATAPPVWLVGTMPYLLAIVVALRTTKVTHKVRQKK